MTRFDKFRSLSLSSLLFSLPQSIFVVGPAGQTRPCVYYASTTRYATVVCLAALAARVMDTGEKSIVARGLLITASIFLFPHPPTYLPLPSDEKFMGFTLAIFSITSSPSLRPRTPNLMKNHSSTPGKPPSIFRKGTIVSARSYRIKSDASSITPINYLDSPSSRDLFLPPARASGWYSNFFDRF